MSVMTLIVYTLHLFLLFVHFSDWYRMCIWKKKHLRLKTNVSGHKWVWAQTCLCTNECVHKCVWVQMCVSTNVCGHKRVWTQTCFGTKVFGHKRVWAQMCMDTNVSGHKCVWVQMCVSHGILKNIRQCMQHFEFWLRVRCLVARFFDVVQIKIIVSMIRWLRPSDHHFCKIF